MLRYHYPPLHFKPWPWVFGLLLPRDFRSKLNRTKLSWPEQSCPWWQPSNMTQHLRGQTTTFKRKERSNECKFLCRYPITSSEQKINKRNLPTYVDTTPAIVTWMVFWKTCSVQKNANSRRKKYPQFRRSEQVVVVLPSKFVVVSHNPSLSYTPTSATIHSIL